MAEKGVPGITVTPRLPTKAAKRRRLEQVEDDVNAVLSTIRQTRHVHEARVQLGRRRVNISLVLPDRRVVRAMIMTQHPDWATKRVNDAVNAWLLDYEKKELRKFRSEAE